MTDTGRLDVCHGRGETGDGRTSEKVTVYTRSSPVEFRWANRRSPEDRGAILVVSGINE